jgi:type II secretory pathway component PulF
MPSYRYKAIDDVGKTFRGKLVALDHKDAELRMTREGLTLITSKLLKESRLEKIFSNVKVKPRLLIELYRRLSQTLNMGLSIVAALEENSKLLPSRALKRTLSEISISIEKGQTLHESVSRFPKVFNRLDLSIIHMGEQTGVVPKCFKDLADFHEWKEDLRASIKKAAIYPAFVLITLLVVLGVWVGYVLPQMAVLLSEMGVAIPAITQAVLNSSNFVRSNWAVLSGGVLIFITTIFLLQRNRRGAILMQQYLLRLPLLGNVILNIALARLCRYFAAMYSAGMSINTIFEVLADGVIGNRYLESRLVQAYHDIQVGHTIAESFDKTNAFPQLLVGGIKNGETTGTVDETFNRLGDFYDGEVKRSVQILLGSIEPLTMIMLGGVFGLIILSILLPLYDVFGQLGKAY